MNLAQQGIKRHLEGGSLRDAMVTEIKRVMSEFSGQVLMYEKAAQVLGISSRSLRNWTGPVEKGGWPELQGIEGAVEKLLAVTSKGKMPQRKKTVAKKKRVKKGANGRAASHSHA